MFEYFNTLRFRLTLYYTGLFVILSLILLITINVLAYRYYQNTEVRFDTLSKYTNLVQEPFTNNSAQNQFLEIIRQVRSDDLSTIRRSSFFIFAVLVGLSLAGGNAISMQILSPIKDINRQIRAIQAESIEKIDYPHLDEELQELTASINEMLMRLGKSFRSQKEFVEYASHELKTPLSIIMAKTDLILMDTPQASHQAELLSQIQSQIEYLNDLIDDLSLLSLSKEHLQFESTTMQSILDTVIENTHIKAEAKGITIQSKGKNLTQSLPLVPILITQALENILENAIQYSFENRSVSIETVVYKKFLTIQIKDNGVGIPAEVMHRIFDKFYRVDSSRSRHTGGRGLGLALTKAIIALHNGTIKVESTKGKGTTFILHIPIG